MKLSYAVASAMIVLSACATTPQVGRSPDPLPPQLVVAEGKDANGRQLLRWDRPSAFGQVSGAQKVSGDIACMSAGIEYEAIGYHPRARNVQGKEMPGGGYFCGLKKNGDQPDTTPPRLVRIDGLLGWDRPSAFGRVPDQAKDRGNKICKQINSDLLAVGYHPQARHENGTQIIDGGFFCVPKPRI